MKKLAFILLTMVLLPFFTPCNIGNNKTTIEGIQQTFDSFVSSKEIHEAILFIENSTRDISESFGYGGKGIDSPFFTASVSKLFVTSSILILEEQGRLSLDDKLIQFFDDSFLKGIHVFEGVEYSFDLTVSNLLFQTSGLPNPFVEDNIWEQQAQGFDRYISLDSILHRTREIGPHFAPNTEGKSYYSCVNFHILVMIIEEVTGKSIDRVFGSFIFTPLGMNNTYVPTDESDYIPTMFSGSELVYLPISFRSSLHYEAVSTAYDLMLFIRAFWGGTLFSQDVFAELSNYNELQSAMSPVHYGGGHMRLWNLIGHTGAYGAFAFYYSNMDLFIVGNVNQMSDPVLPFALAVFVAMQHGIAQFLNQNIGALAIYLISAAFFVIMPLLLFVKFLWMKITKGRGSKSSDTFSRLSIGLLLCGTLFTVNWAIYGIRYFAGGMFSILSNLVTQHVWVNYILLALAVILFVASIVFLGRDEIRVGVTTKRKFLYFIIVVFLVLQVVVLAHWGYFVVMQ